MVVVSHNGGRSWDDSACHDHRDVKNTAVRGTIQFAMAVVIHKCGRLCDDSAYDDHRDVKTQPLVGRFNS